MKHFSMARSVPALAAASLAAFALSLALPPAARAQGPQNGGPGQQNRRSPFMFGVVSAVDATAGTITVTTPFGNGDSQTIQTSSATTITSQTAATVSDLKTGDQVQVQGVPTGITATTVTIGQPPIQPGGFGGPGGFGRRGGPGGGSAAGGGAGGGPMQPFATASGTVASTSPLTITLSGSVSLTLKLDPKAKVTRFSTLPLSGIKVGDRIMSSGQTGDDGTFTATSIGVNLAMGNMGQRGGPGGGRMRGMGQQGGGPGGPPGGGQGMGQGGGQGGPPDGGPGGPPPPDGGQGGPPPPSD